MRWPKQNDRGNGMRKSRIGNIVLVTALACGLMLSGAARAQEKLTVWWVKGFYKSEDDALFAAIKKYEDKTGVKVDLSQYAVQERRRPEPGLLAAQARELVHVGAVQQGGKATQLIGFGADAARLGAEIIGCRHRAA